MTASELVAALRAHRAPAEPAVIDKRLGPGDDATGVRVRDPFDTAKAAVGMPLDGDGRR